MWQNIIITTGMRDRTILKGKHGWSRQNNLSWVLFILSFPFNILLNNNPQYIKMSFSIGYVSRYVNWKSDYLELLLSVYMFDEL